MQKDQETQENNEEIQPEVAAEPTSEEKIAALEAALEEAKASVLYVKAEGKTSAVVHLKISTKPVNLR